MTAPVDPTLLSGLPRIIADAVKLALPELTECVPHPGRFDLRELEAFAARAPAVRIALLGLGRGVEVGGPAWEHDLSFGAFVVTTDRANLPRQAAAVNIVQKLVTLISANRWQTSGIGQASGITADNLYNPTTRQRGIALWGVSWTHKAQLYADPAAVDPLPAALYASGLGPAADDPVLISGDAP